MMTQREIEIENDLQTVCIVLTHMQDAMHCAIKGGQFVKMCGLKSQEMTSRVCEATSAVVRITQLLNDELGSHQKKLRAESRGDASRAE